MDVRDLKVEGALEFTPTKFPDERGVFVSPFQEAAFVGATGSRLFQVAQTNHSVSRRGVVRGVHFTVTPPGTAKYVYCPRGAALDIVVDIREGSPTFGACDFVQMDQNTFRAMYFPVGVGHAFVALTDDTIMSYMLSGSYVPQNESALYFLDPELGLPVPHDIEPQMSERDQVAPTLASARALGMLPDYAECRRLEQHLSR